MWPQMTSHRKRLDIFKANPANSTLSDLLSIIERAGFSLARKTKGSHLVYRREGCKQIVLSPHGGDCKPYQKKEVYRILKEAGLLLLK